MGDSASEPSKPIRRAWRLRFRLDQSGLVLTAQEPVAAIAPMSPGSLHEGPASGAWIEVRDREGRVLAHRTLHDPFGVRLATRFPDGTTESVEREVRTGEVEVLVPAFPDAAAVVFYSSPLVPGRAHERAQQLGRFELTPGGHSSPRSGPGGASAASTDGAVLPGVEKVVDHGPDSERWNLVVLGDGYLKTELGKYAKDVEAIWKRMMVTPPYAESWCGVNVHRVDVVSDEKGATEDCSGLPDKTVKNFFKATFCAFPSAKLLTVDEDLALKVAQEKLPVPHEVMVVVNTSRYGGAGRWVAVCSTGLWSEEIAIHELGHVAYGLGDEYREGRTTPLVEPQEPNVTIDVNRATNKWRDLILPSTPMPSACAEKCTDCTPPAVPPPAGAVGTYEGAGGADCGAYSPAEKCFMNQFDPFCPVCARVIRETLKPFLPPETVTLKTPSVSFLDVPEGMGGASVTVVREVEFEVVTCRPLTLAFKSTPAPPFGAPMGPSVKATTDPVAPFQRAKLAISYSSTIGSSSVTGSVVVRCEETGQEWTIPITANTVGRPPTAVVLVLDRSGSMIEQLEDGTSKAQKLREAAGIFVEAMLPGDGIGLVRFDDTAQVLMGVEDVGASGSGAGRQAALAHIGGAELDPAGATSIGAGVQAGRTVLNAAVSSPDYGAKAMVVLTDGMENTAPALADVSSKISANTFAIGLGLPANISTAALNTLVQGHNGYLLVTGDIGPDRRAKLAKYFLQILSGISNANVVLDPAGEIGEGVEHRIPFHLSDADYGFEAFVISPHPELLRFELETPSGKRIGPAAASSSATISMVARNGVSFYRSALPALTTDVEGSHSGTWHVVLGISPASGPSTVGEPLLEREKEGEERRTLPYDVLVHSYSNLVLKANVWQSSQEPGARVHLSATLSESGLDVGERATVWAEVERPDGGTETVSLPYEGSRYTAEFTAASPGLYAVRIRAQGQTLSVEPFVREQAATVVAVPGADNPTVPIRPRPGCLSRLCRRLRHWLGL